MSGGEEVKRVDYGRRTEVFALHQQSGHPGPLVLYIREELVQVRVICACEREPRPSSANCVVMFVKERVMDAWNELLWRDTSRCSLTNP